MVVRVAVLVPVWLGLVPAISAQYTGEPPSLVRTFAVDSALPLSTFGLWNFESFQFRRLPTGDDLVAVCGRQSPTSPSQLSAWRRDAITGNYTRLSHFDPVAQPDDTEVTVSHDGLTAVVFRNGFGLSSMTRDSVDAPFGNRQPVTGTPPGSYSARLGRWRLRESLLTCQNTGSAPPTVTVQFFDARTGTASGGHALRPQTGGPGTYFHALATMDSPTTGKTEATLFAERSSSSRLQRWHFASGLDGTSPIHVAFDSPTQNLITGATQVSGGRFAFACQGLPISAFPNCALKAEIACVVDSRAPSTGGPLDLTLHGPARSGGAPDVGIFAVGALGSSGIQIPGLIGRFGLDPGLWTVIAVQNVAASGRATVTFTTGPMAPARLSLQSFVVDPFVQQVAASCTAVIDIF